MYAVLRKLLFRLAPESAHRLGLSALSWCPRWCFPRVPAVPCRVMGLDFPNPVGLAAGLDKNADYINGLAKLGFGFIEVGTVTPKPQPGNPPPRLFRSVGEQALINRLGFNNKGVDYLVAQLKATRYQGIIGVNIGKNASTPIEQAVADYRIGMTKVYPYASYITVNISSPNTQQLRTLQQPQHLSPFLDVLKRQQAELAEQHQRYVPLVVKLSPDLSDTEIIAIAQVLLTCKIDGVIATNTTQSRKQLEPSEFAQQSGGLSGKPLTELSDRTINQLNKFLSGEIPIIGVGGIMNGDDARAKRAAGACLVQLYTGLIYRGPELIRECVEQA